MDCDAISQGIAGGIFNIIKQAYTGDLCEDNKFNGKLLLKHPLMGQQPT